MVFVLLISSFFISASLVSAASARGTFTITNDSANAPQLSPDESLNQSQEQTNNQAQQSSFFTAIKNFFKAFFNLFRK